jgi:hypothetical protein
MVRPIPGVIAVVLTVTGWTTPALGQDAAADTTVLIVEPPGGTGHRVGNFPLVVAFHPNGSTAEAMKVQLAAEHLARRGRVVVALPQARVPAGTGFRWGSVEEADELFLQAEETALMQARIQGAPRVLLGFGETATLACAVALRRPVAGVIAVGPGRLAEPVALPNSRAMRLAILCTEGEPGARDCQDTGALLKRLRFPVDLRLLTPERARAGMDRLLEALTWATWRY